MQGIVGRAQRDMRDLQDETREDGSDEVQSNNTGHAALSACVGELTFSCKDAASPSTQSFDRGVLKRSEGVKSFWNSGLSTGWSAVTRPLVYTLPSHNLSRATVSRVTLYSTATNKTERLAGGIDDLRTERQMSQLYVCA